MTTIDRSTFLGLTQRRFTTVEIAGLTFRIRSLTESEKTEFEASILSAKGEFSVAKVKRQRRRLILWCLVDDQGNQLLQPDDEDALKQIDGAIASKLYEACRNHCGFDDADIEELVKNSNAIQGGDLPTD